MKIFCILITFVIGTVLAVDDANYMKTVFLTNLAFEHAYNKNDFIVGDNLRANGLEHIIEKMVCDVSSFNIEDYYVNYDKTDIVNNLTEFEYLNENSKCIHYQYMMQIEITNTLKITIPKPDNGIDFEVLNLTTLAEQRRSLVKPALKNIFRRLLGSMYKQFMMQLEIRDLLTDEARDLGGLNLTTLAEQRRVTGTSLQNTIGRVLGTDIPEIVKDQSRCAIDVTLLRMCRLIGLYISANFPTSYIKKLLIDFINGTCTLDDGTTQRKYKQINGVVWQISKNTLG